MTLSVLSLLLFALVGSCAPTDKGKGHIIIAGGPSHQPIPIPIPFPVPYIHNYNSGWSNPQPFPSSQNTQPTNMYSTNQSIQMVHPYNSYYRQNPQVIQPNYYPTKIVVLPIITNIDDEHQARWNNQPIHHSPPQEQYLIQPLSGPHQHGPWGSSLW